MKIINDYLILQSGPSVGSLPKVRLAEKVKELIAKGWEPLGGVCPYGGMQLLQAMVKYENKEDDNEIHK